MKININVLFLIILLLCEKFLPSYKVNFALQFLSLGFLLYDRKVVFSKAFFNLLTPLLAIFLLGFVGFLFNEKDFSGTIKDITYFLKPILTLCIGYVFISKLENKVIFYKTIVYVAVFFSIVHIIGILFSGNFLKSMHDIRKDNGLDNFIEVFAFYILLFYEKFNNQSLIKTKQNLKFYLILLFVSILCYFSRTMLVVFIFVGMAIAGYFRITKRAILFLAILTLFSAFFFIVLSNVNLDRNAKGLEAFLYKIKVAPEEIFEAKIDRNNHKDLWDHWRGYEAKRAFALMNEKKSSYVYGAGYGSWVNLKFQAPVGEEDMKYISRLHNGYVFVLYKTGIIGLLMYIFFLSNIYRYCYFQGNMMDSRLIGSIGVFYFFTSLVITGIYIPGDLIAFILGGLLAVREKKLVL